jgi:Zn-dependent protease
MLFNLLFEDVQIFLMIILAIIFALTIHEFSHALAASLLGDNTAKHGGRLNLNPLSHMEFFGTLMLLFAGFGWGKPVPVNPYNLKWRRWGTAVVSLAGPVSNFLSVILFVLIANLLANWLSPTSLLFEFLFYLIFINLILGVFNLIPIPPLDGSKVLFAVLPSHLDDFKRKFAVNGPYVLIALIILDRITSLNIFGSIFNWFISLLAFFL